MSSDGTIRIAILAALLFGALVTWVGCESKGPAQRAGESIDKGMQDAKDAMNPPGFDGESGTQRRHGRQALRPDDASLAHRRTAEPLGV
jgi:hypothetical protein